LRPLSAPRPTALGEPKGPNGEVAPQVRLVDQGLVTRMQAIAAAYRGKKVRIISGYRPQSDGSHHKLGKAMDVRVEGVSNEALATFCRSLPDTGCGYYPNSTFVHVDVRPRGTGHVYWIDASGPGERARYVATWPPPKDAPAAEIPRPDHAAPGDEHTHGDADGKSGHGIGESDRGDEVVERVPGLSG